MCVCNQKQKYESALGRFIMQIMQTRAKIKRGRCTKSCEGVNAPSLSTGKRKYTHRPEKKQQQQQRMKQTFTLVFYPLNTEQPIVEWTESRPTD